jgi:hypothetical protein
MNSVVCVFNMSGQITHGSHCIVFMIADNGVVVSFLDIVEQDLSYILLTYICMRFHCESLATYQCILAQLPGIFYIFTFIYHYFLKLLNTTIILRY